MNTAADLRVDFERRLTEARRLAETVRVLPESCSPSDVVSTFDRIERELDAPLSLFIELHPEADVRAAGRELQQELSSFLTGLALDRGLYERLAAIDPAELTDADARRFLELTLRDYRRSGVDQDEATRARIKALHEELVEIGQAFTRNIAEDTRTLEIPDGPAGLDGLPADYVESHPPDPDGVVRVTTDPPDYIPFMTFANRADLRERLSGLMSQRAWPVNEDVLKRLIEKRHELARLLGYESWADYVTEDKMVGSGAAAGEFIARLRGLIAERAAAELDELRACKERLGQGDGPIRLYERAYLTERLKQERYRFDSQEARPYFAYENVKQGVFATSEALFGVTFERDEGAPVWHESVECWNVVDDGEVVARFWLDMHPRPDKFKHAAMFDMRKGIEGEVLPEACLGCNFPRPTADDPALLLHSQVTTFFHEFGHLLHHLFSTQRFSAIAGIATEWDFVEVPSQMYEEWAWDAGVLARFATHHETGEPIPAELVARMRAAEEYGKAIQLGTQMFYASLSLSYYDRDPRELDLAAHMHALAREAPIPQDEDSHFYASFGHLHGYSAMYYTYAWSQVIAKDFFSRFEGDLMNDRTANEYRATVLSAGGSKDANELVRDFLGRDYSFEAFERWLRA